MIDDPEYIDWREVLQTIQRQRKLPRAQWARLAGISEGTIRNYMSGTSNDLRAGTIEKLARALGMSIHQMVAAAKNGHSVSEQQSTSGMVEIDELDARAAGGHGAINGDHENLPTARWVLPIDVVRGNTSSPTENIKIITVIGDSMIPDFFPGEKIMVDTFDRRPSPPGVFIIWDGIASIVKRIEYHHDDIDPTIELISANTEYKRKIVPASTVMIQGRVIGKWQRI